MNNIKLLVWSSSYNQNSDFLFVFFRLAFDISLVGFLNYTKKEPCG